MAKYTIFANRLEELTKVYKRYAKKANAIGLETSLSVGEPYVKEIPCYVDDHINKISERKEDIPVNVVDVEISFPDYKLGEYSVVAVIDHTAEKYGNVVHSFGMEIPSKYNHGAGICEHCHTAHRRNTTVLLTDSTGILRQVGTNCLKEYTGVTEISLLNAYQAIAVLLEISDSEKGEYIGKKELEKTVNYVAKCVNYINRFGYHRGVKSEVYNIDFTENDRKMAENVIAYFTSREFNDTFYHNISVNCKKDYTKLENGFLAYAYVAYRTEMEKAAENAKTEFYGNIGDRIELEVTGKVLTSYPNSYGSIYNVVETYIFEFRDTDGHIFIWKTSSDFVCGDDGIFKGKIKATIKAHNEYNGKKQTVITRVKVV